MDNVSLMASFSLFFPGLIAEDTISPVQDEVSGTEGQSVSLTCNYQTDDDDITLDWYKHQSDLHAPEFILWKEGKGGSGEYIPDKNKNRYGSQTSDTSTTLTIRELTLADTALYYCAVRDTVIQSVAEAVQKPEHRYETPLQRGGKWYSEHSFISDGFC